MIDKISELQRWKLTSVHKNIMSDREVKSLINVISSFLVSHSKEETNENASLEESIFIAANNLYAKKQLGITLASFNKSDYMKHFSLDIKRKLSQRYELHFEEFPINSLRIMLSTFADNKLSWHQDEATWQTQKELRGYYPFTFWFPLIKSKFSSIEIANKPSQKIFYHRHVDKQGRFAADIKSKNMNTKIYDDLDIGSCVSFSSTTLHRTHTSIDFKNEKYVRMSIDLRYCLPESQKLAVESRESARLKLVNLLQQ